MKINRKHQPRGFFILWEDSNLIIGSKASGVLSVPNKSNKLESLKGRLDNYVKKGNSYSKNQVHIIHRLDQATSGLIAFAKNEKTREFMIQNWKSAEKTYLAVVYGHLKEKKGIIKNYLYEDENYFVRSVPENQSHNMGAELAITEYNVLAEIKGKSLVQVQLKTGKKNQIRVHFSEMGHAIVGDEKYKSSKVKSSVQAEDFNTFKSQDKNKNQIKNIFHKNKFKNDPYQQNFTQKNLSHKNDLSQKILLHSWKLAFLNPANQMKELVVAHPPEAFKNLFFDILNDFEKSQSHSDASFLKKSEVRIK